MKVILVILISCFSVLAQNQNKDYEFSLGLYLESNECSFEGFDPKDQIFGILKVRERTKKVKGKATKYFSISKVGRFPFSTKPKKMKVSKNKVTLNSDGIRSTIIVKETLIADKKSESASLVYEVRYAGEVCKLSYSGSAS